ncbi:hypothetical protein ACPV5J_07900 [Vibrio rotiferianus]|uniref:hypothetical protein n=1 Tax=Vibrio rotiferianus TaxID=190895 RepID=UPI00406A350C
MPYIYSIEIKTDAQDDVNQKFRDNQLKGEVVVDDMGTVFICPQISNKIWCTPPKSNQLTTAYDPQWDQVIEDALNYMTSHYSVTVKSRQPIWRNILKPFRCPKMVLYIKSRDLFSH